MDYDPERDPEVLAVRELRQGTMRTEIRALWILLPLALLVRTGVLLPVGCLGLVVVGYILHRKDRARREELSARYGVSEERIEELLIDVGSRR